MIARFLRHITLSQELTTTAFVVIIAFVGVASWFGYASLTSLSTRVAALDAELASTTALLRGSINDATTSLADALQQEKKSVQAQLGDVQDQVGSIGGTVTDLQKLSKTDPELLAKYSKVFFLSDNYAPARLVDIPPEYKYLDYVPADDLTDPAPATTFAHLDGTVVLSRPIAELGIYPAVDPLDSTSRILDPIVLGKEHYEVARQVQVTLQK